MTPQFNVQSKMNCMMKCFFTFFLHHKLPSLSPQLYMISSPMAMSFLANRHKRSTAPNTFSFMTALQLSSCASFTHWQMCPVVPSASILKPKEKLVLPYRILINCIMKQEGPQGPGRSPEGKVKSLVKIHQVVSGKKLFKEIVDGQTHVRTTDNVPSQKLILSNLCSGELKPKCYNSKLMQSKFQHNHLQIKVVYL